MGSRETGVISSGVERGAAFPSQPLGLSYCIHLSLDSVLGCSFSVRKSTAKLFTLFEQVLA